MVPLQGQGSATGEDSTPACTLIELMHAAAIASDRGARCSLGNLDTAARQRVPFLANSAIESMFVLSMNAGPVRTGCPPPMMFLLLRSSHS